MLFPHPLQWHAFLAESAYKLKVRESPDGKFHDVEKRFLPDNKFNGGDRQKDGHFLEAKF